MIEVNWECILVLVGLWGLCGDIEGKTQGFWAWIGCIEDIRCVCEGCAVFSLMGIQIFQFVCDYAFKPVIEMLD